MVEAPEKPVRQETLQVCPVVKLPQLLLNWVASGSPPVHMEGMHIGMLPISAIWLVDEFQPQLHCLTDEPLCRVYPAAQLTTQLVPEAMPLQLFCVPTTVGMLLAEQDIGWQVGVEPKMEPDPAASQVTIVALPS